MATKKRGMPGPGRPALFTDPVRVTVVMESSVLRLADEVVEAMIGAGGVRLGRVDVLRGALARGLEQMKSEQAERTKR